MPRRFPRPATAALNFANPIRMIGIEIGKDYEARLGTPADILCQLSTCCSVVPWRRARSLARWITGPSATGSLKGNAEFDDVRARFNGRQRNVSRGRKIGIAAGEIGDERRTILEE